MGSDTAEPKAPARVERRPHPVLLVGASFLGAGIVGSMVTWTADMPTPLGLRPSSFLVLSLLSIGTLPLTALVLSAVPGLGPILAASQHFTAANATGDRALQEHHRRWGTVAVVSGLAQATGVALLITGAIAGAARLGEDLQRPPPVSVSLQVTGDGVSVRGRF